jgi:ribosomal protein S18 acetylase RimI-like enzyme
MSIKLIEHNSAEYQTMIFLRMNILREPLGLSFTKEDLEKEKNDILLCAYDDDNMVGCCILTKINDETCQLRQMAVIPAMQKNGLGRGLLDFAEKIAYDNGFRKMIMHARKTALGFYQKQGYEIEGEEFEEVTIPHFEMRKRLIKL